MSLPFHPVPKPAPRVKAPKPLKRTSGVKATNPKRRQSEFARCYGPKARVEYVKQLPCAACGVVGYSENAHVMGVKGASHKGDADTIAPLCGPHWTGVSAGSECGDVYVPGCHHDFDRQRWVFDQRHRHFDAALMAEETERKWIAFSGGEEP